MSRVLPQPPVIHCRLHVPTMDAVLVEYAPDGRVRFEDEEWTTPTTQEIRAILHAAQERIAELTDLMLSLDSRKA